MRNAYLLLKFLSNPRRTPNCSNVALKHADYSSGEAQSHKTYMKQTHISMLICDIERLHPSCSNQTERCRIIKQKTHICKRTTSLIDKRATVCHPHVLLVCAYVRYSRARSIEHTQTRAPMFSVRCEFCNTAKLNWEKGHGKRRPHTCSIGAPSSMSNPICMRSQTRPPRADALGLRPKAVPSVFSSNSNQFETKVCRNIVLDLSFTMTKFQLSPSSFNFRV